MSRNIVEALVEEAQKRPEMGEVVLYFEQHFSDPALQLVEIERMLSAMRQALRSQATKRNQGISLLICSFCKRPEQQIAKLVTSSDAAICDECILGAADAIFSARDSRLGRGWRHKAAILLQRLARWMRPRSFAD